MKSALVTGGNGFLGKYVVQGLLDKGYCVKSLNRSRSEELEALGVEVIQGDLGDYDAVEKAVRGVDTVFHVAAKAGIWGSWKSFYVTNVLGTQNVIKACKAQDVGKLVYTSTPSVVFNGNAFNGEDESLPYGKNWLCHYAHTKAIAEEMVLLANHVNGLRTTALRPHLIWGHGDQNLIPRVLERARMGKLRIVGDGRNLVDITHVKNAAEAQLLASDGLETGVACGKAYFISQGEPVRLWDWINGLLRRMEIPEVERRISAKIGYLAGGWLELFYKALRIQEEPLMTRFLAVELSKNHYFSIENAKRDLHYSPSVSIEEGLDELVAKLKG